jgi:hypothetical protein
VKLSGETVGQLPLEELIIEYVAGVPMKDHPESGITPWLDETGVPPSVQEFICHLFGVTELFQMIVRLFE